ncbi:MAG: type II toxin-antitoxin system VapC family toxin [Gemmataceae bacterium]|nr:type II toxin-antitoxin system VapC family toxin [Gemmataceae bacterium]
MTVLLDTRAAIWFWEADPRLSRAAEAVIADPNNVKLLSPASPWEAAIKVAKARLALSGGFPGYFPRNMLRTGFVWLPPTDAHFVRLTTLPAVHADPFDRLIAAQSLAEGIEVVSIDPKLDLLGVRRIW